jgi:hypothetical protein
LKPEKMAETVKQLACFFSRNLCWRHESIRTKSTLGEYCEKRVITDDTVFMSILGRSWSRRTEGVR